MSDELDAIPELPNLAVGNGDAGYGAPDLSAANARGGVVGGFPVSSMANSGANVKWNLYKAYGYPPDVTPEMLWELHERGATASAIVEILSSACWQTDPEVRRTPEGKMDSQEELLNAVLRRVWSKFQDADRRSLCGSFAALILVIADGRDPSMPVGPIKQGLGAAGLVNAEPVSDFDMLRPDIDNNQLSRTYGQVLKYRYTPQDMSGNRLATQDVHPDRVIIMSPDGTMRRRPFLAPMVNAIINLEKLEGAYPEAALKVARSLTHFNVDTALKVTPGVGGVAQITPVEGDAKSGSLKKAAKNVKTQVDNMNGSFENMVFTKGVSSSMLAPKLSTVADEIWALRATIAAAANIPMRVLFGSQSGERSSTEDRKEFNIVCDSRRNDQLIPRVMELVQRMVSWGMIDGGNPSDPRRMPWEVRWEPLVQATNEERLAQAREMREFYTASRAAGELGVTVNEIRAKLQLEPITKAQIEENAALFAGLLPEPEETLLIEDASGDENQRVDNNATQSA